MKDFLTRDYLFLELERERASIKTLGPPMQCYANFTAARAFQFILRTNVAICKRAESLLIRKIPTSKRSLIFPRLNLLTKICWNQVKCSILQVAGCMTSHQSPTAFR